ncbi:OVARIAN TUMOR DOMAIN-containing deubiquitinating enzyme 9-like isoform X9 [Miscanthus floridulus]|uniref:OVARIAN TUMOR DOMAIN-containing deubiquitinating enzyme 9-like isoform X9 n=1 Tax=Miscanthus floridulus TaxID=154761 RepID=UPI00345872F8
MSMCEKDQNLPWGYDLFRDPFAPPNGYYGPPPGYCDGHCCDLHYGRAHPDETQLHSSQLTYDLYNPSHVPKINGEIPSIDEATMDHERLTERLKLYELVEHKVQGDGNCQFRALSDQLYQSPDHHEFVREQIINQLKTNRDAYDGYVPMAYDDYLEKVARNGEWGDHVTLQAAADKYGVKIFVMTSFKDTCYIEIQPKVQKSNKVVLLSFWAEVHYNSIYPQNDAPRSQTTTKRRRWWPFSQHHHH